MRQVLVFENCWSAHELQHQSPGDVLRTSVMCFMATAAGFLASAKLHMAVMTLWSQGSKLLNFFEQWSSSWWLPRKADIASAMAGKTLRMALPQWTS